MVRTKFTCESITMTKHWDGSGRFLYTASMRVVMAGSDENKAFFAATPSGSVQVGSFLQNMFEVGEEYFVDFTSVKFTSIKQAPTFSTATAGTVTITTTGTNAQYKLFNTNEGTTNTDKKQGV